MPAAIVQSRPRYRAGSLSPGYYRTEAMWGGPGASWLNTILPDNAALATNTVRDAVRARFAYELNKAGQGGWINTVSFTCDPNAADRFTPLVPFHPAADSNARFYGPVRDALLGGFALPPGVTPNPDTGGGLPDRVLCVHDPFRDKYYEVHVARLASETASGLNEYSWGGVMSQVSQRATGRWRNKTDSTWGGAGLNEDDQMGASGSGLPIMPLGITRADCRRWNARTGRRGCINHPIGVMVPPATVAGTQVWPALRHDTGSGDGYEWGRRTRLAHDYEITATNDYVVMLQDALIHYGTVGHDTAFGGLILRGEPGVELEFPDFDPNAIVRALDWAQHQVLAVGDDSTHTPTS